MRPLADRGGVKEPRLVGDVSCWERIDYQRVWMSLFCILYTSSVNHVHQGSIIIKIHNNFILTGQCFLP